MLHPDLHLNENLFTDTVASAPTRNGYGEALLSLGETNPEVVVLTADLSESTRCEGFAKKYPQRFFDCGVAEQNMAAIAAGMGVSGKTPFISSYATFSPGKNWETVRTTIVYNQSNVKVAGHHAGIMTGPDGATHQATEDIAITRCWPTMQVIVPCDAIEAKKATIAAATTPGPLYLRFTRDKTPIITSQDTPFAIGKMQTFWTSEKPLAAILGTGYMLYYALLAAKDLEAEGISTLVINVPTIKPIDIVSLTEIAKQTNAIVTVEDHQITGGLGGAVAECLSKVHPVVMEYIGLQDTFAESGNPKELLTKYGMDSNAIKAAVKKVIASKKRFLMEIG